MNQRQSWLVMFVAAMLVSGPVDAKRLGGGRDLGRKAPAELTQRAVPAPARPVASPEQPAASRAPSAQAAPAPAPGAPARSGVSRWLGPLAGVVAGLGLAAWLSHLGLGGGLAMVVLTALLVLGGLGLWHLLKTRRQTARAGWVATPAYAHTGLGAEAAVSRWVPPAPAAGSMATPTPPVAPVPGMPADFDAPAFVRQAKVVFMRLQGAFDAGDTHDLAEFTRPELWAELKLEIAQRDGRANQTDVLTLDAELVGVTTQDGEQWASVRFKGVVREHPVQEAVAIDELWNFSRPVQGEGGWVLSGIEQLSAA